MVYFVTRPSSVIIIYNIITCKMIVFIFPPPKSIFDGTVVARCNNINNKQKRNYFFPRNSPPERNVPNTRPGANVPESEYGLKFSMFFFVLLDFIGRPPGTLERKIHTRFRRFESSGRTVFVRNHAGADELLKSFSDGTTRSTWRRR